METARPLTDSTLPARAICLLKPPSIAHPMTADCEPVPASGSKFIQIGVLAIRLFNSATYRDPRQSLELIADSVARRTMSCPPFEKSLAVVSRNRLRTKLGRRFDAACGATDQRRYVDVFGTKPHRHTPTRMQGVVSDDLSGVRGGQSSRRMSPSAPLAAIATSSPKHRRDGSVASDQIKIKRQTVGNGKSLVRAQNCKASSRI
jgi:hypothetical protein